MKNILRLLRKKKTERWACRSSCSFCLVLMVGSVFSLGLKNTKHGGLQQHRPAVLYVRPFVFRPFIPLLKTAEKLHPQAIQYADHIHTAIPMRTKPINFIILLVAPAIIGLSELTGGIKHNETWRIITGAFTIILAVTSLIVKALIFRKQNKASL